MKKKTKKNEINEQEQMENYLDVFKRNYQNVPGFKIVVKLGGYFLFIIILLIVVANNNPDATQTSNKTTTTTAVQINNKKYRELLDELKVYNGHINASINVDKTDYALNSTVTNGTSMEGYLESNSNTIHFAYEDNKLYEIKMNEKKQNDNLLVGINIEYLLPEVIINTIDESTAIIHQDDKETTYEYTINDIKYTVIVNNNKIGNIEITNEQIHYSLIFE